MMNEEYFASSNRENVSLTTTENNAIASSAYDFEIYDRYIEKIRALFVPSLEPRIYDCLENFVYGKDTGLISDYPCLRRCLEMAATLREPVDAFCAKWSDEGYLENMLSHAIKYLIKDGLVDCFLNSIILNNRLNKVCRDLDGLGIERDFLRYLTVWNYINERDYWMENDQRVSMSMFRESHDSIDRNSDLDVEIGSKFRNYRNEKMSKKALKRRATENSSENCREQNNSLEIFHDNDRSMPQLESWLSLDSLNREEYKLHEGKRKRSISQTFPCRPSNCPIYRTKNSRQSDWVGKNLKLKLLAASSIDSKCEPSKSLQLSKLRLPCKYEDLISKIIKADSRLPGLFSISKSKKFQASIINVCRRINEILGKIDKNEVRRCRLNCEIFPGHLSFRMTQRESNGCKICLLTDRVVTNKIEAKSQSLSRDSSVCQLAQITENENSKESGLTIYESARFNLDDESIERIPRSRSKIEAELDISEDRLESKNPNNSKELNLEDYSLNRSNENGVDDQMCHCDAPLDHVFDNFRHETQSNRETSRVNDFLPVTSENNTKELAPELSLVASYDCTPEDLTCNCNESVDDTLRHFDNKPDNNRETDRILKNNTEQGNTEDVTQRESLFHSTVNDDVENQSCLCNDSFDLTTDHLDRSRENNNSKELTSKKSSIHPINDTIDNEECLCSTPFENPPANSDHEAKTVVNQDNCVKCIFKSVEDVSEFNNQESNDSSFVQNVQKLKDHKNELEHSSADALRVKKMHPDLTCSKSITNVPDYGKEAIPYDDIACACPSDCTCPNKDILDDQSENCDSQCSCDSCHDPKAKSLDTQINEPRFRDNSNQMPIINNTGPITASDKIKSSCIETRASSEGLKKDTVQNDSLEKSSLSLKPVATKILSRSLDAREIKITKSDNSVRKIVQCSQTNDSREKLSHKSPPVISARLSRSKGQRINISIELCPESETAMKKIRKNYSKNISTLPNDSKNVKNSRHTESRVFPSLRQSTRHSAYRGNSDIRLNSVSEKNIKDECLDGTNGRAHSPPRPLEFRDYLPPLERASSVRNPNVYGYPIKSVIRSNGKFERRSMSREQRIPKTYETREFSRSNQNKRFCEKNNHRRIRYDENNEGSSRCPRNSEKFSSSIINGHLCHAFSSSSVDRMRHLIKTKLRRILLERDKSTNTPKRILTNEKYRVSVPNGKTENSQFSRQCCRTIWESHSASDSTRTSESFVPKERTGIRDRDEITHLLYSSALRSKSSVSNFTTISRDLNHSRDNSGPIVTRENMKIYEHSEPSELYSMKNCSRLSGGSDFITNKKALGCEEFFFAKSQRSRLSKVERKNQCLSDLKDQKLCGKSINCNFHDIFENKLGHVNNDDWNDEILEKKIDREFIACSGKLDSSLNSTSRHIYLYEFAQFETSNDETLESRCWHKRDGESLKKVCSSLEICKDRVDKKGLRRRKKVVGKNARDTSLRQVRLSPKGHDVSRDKNETKNSSSNTNTMNSRQKGFSYLDHDLRSKLSQYVSLCKSVKYSLLKRLRPDDTYEFRGTSISCGDRYKFGNS